MIKEIKIPKRRIKGLVKFKEKIEKLGGVSLDIRDGDVLIEGDAVNVYAVERVLKAFSRGFSIDDSLNLLDDDYILYVLPIAKKKNDLIRLRSRLIGTEGKIKKRIERMTGVKISIYGKTVSIIGKGDEVEYARVAIENILKGRKFGTVFSTLEKMSREI